jgi:hypothetical protein
VAFAPAVRGYPGGIADMASDLDEYDVDLAFGDDELWEPATEAEPEDTTAAGPVDAAGDAAGPGATLSQAGLATAEAGAPAPDQQAPAQHLPGEGSRSPVPAAPVSVWQQSAAAWQEAGIDWMRPAAAGPRPAGGLATEDDPHTEPIPVLAADGSVRAPRNGDKAGRSQTGSPSAGSSSAGVGGSPEGPSAGSSSAGVGGSPEGPSAGGPSAGVGASSGGPSAGGPSAGVGAEAGVTSAAEVKGAAAGADAPTTADTAAPSAAAASAASVAASPGQAGRAAAHEQAGPSVAVDADAGAAGASEATAAGVAPGGTTQAEPAKKARPDKRKKASPGQGKQAGPGRQPASGTQAGPEQPSGPGRQAGPGLGDKPAPGLGDKPAPGRGKTGETKTGETKTGETKTGRTRPGKRVMVVAVIALALVAGTLASIGIARSGGPGKPEFTLVTPYPPAALADTELAGQAAGVTSLPGSLAGIAAAGKTVVAVGAEPSQPAPVPLILYSADGGHTWARAALAAPGTGAATGPGSGAPAGPGLTTGPGAAGPGATAGPTAAGGPGTAPELIAHSGSTWLALGQDAAWTSPDGRTWHPAPAVPPVAGDTVLGLAGTGTGFVAVGEHTGPQRGPVVWTSSAGRPWQRWTGPARGLIARSGHVTALRWVAAQGAVVVAGGPITGSAGQGERPYAGVWRSTDGGLTWRPVTLPAGHGSTDGLAGLAASGAGFVAVRPGHAAGRQDAVAYRSAQGVNWRYADKLTPVRRTSLLVTTMSGNSHGFVVAASVHGAEVAFTSARGRDWHQTTAGAGAGVAGLTAGPGGTVVVAGNIQPETGAAEIRPHLILIGPAARRQVGQAVLAASATPDVTVNGLAAGGGVLVAAGSAGGSPALWLASSGRWAPVGVLLPQAWRNGALVSVAHGGDGWLAIGRAGAAPSAEAPVPAVPPASQPVVLTSATGTSWTTADTLGPLVAPGNVLAQAAAGPAGYVVVGSARTGGTTVGGATASGNPASGDAAPAAWYSKNLSTWAHATLPVPGSYVSAGAPGSQVLAVTAAAPGFVAVGSAGSSPAAWTSQNGSAWNFTAVPLPAGATGAALTQVTAQGTREVAAGYAWRAGSAPVPFAAVSADGGRTWRDARLPTPNAPAVVTALTATAHGFVAVGHTAPPGRPAMLAWWSADGLTWQDGVSAGGGPGRSLVTQINAVTAGNGTLTGAGFAVSTTAEHPVLWHARYR